MPISRATDDAIFFVIAVSSTRYRGLFGLIAWIAVIELCGLIAFCMTDRSVGRNPLEVLLFAFAALDTSIFLATSPYLFRFVRLSQCDDSSAPPVDFAEVPVTVIVVPTLLVNLHGIRRTVEGIERHYLANRHPSFYFGLLTDFCDAPTKDASNDEALLEAAKMMLGELNRRYSETESDRFFMLHRPRVWSPMQNAWMGRERKRGKLDDLNEFLVMGDTSAFCAVVGATAPLVGARYVITLDDDNELMADGALRLVRHMQDARNAPSVDSATNVVTRGHGILQPITYETLPLELETGYQRIVVASGSLLDSVEAFYSSAFDEASYQGKGIYCVRTFRQVLRGRLPEQRILSHDILEGCYLRSGLVSDVVISEQPPPGIIQDMARTQRWIRGDWQVLSWALPATPSQTERRNRLSALSRWKMLDNARRSLGPISLFAFLLAGWLDSKLRFTVLVCCIVFRAVPAVLTSLAIVVRESQVADSLRKSYGVMSLASVIFREVLYFMTLPAFAYRSLISIATAHWRVLVTKRNMLEWVASARASSLKSSGYVGTLIGLLPNYFTVFGYFILAHFGVIEVGWESGVFVCLWAVAPVTVHRTSQIISTMGDHGDSGDLGA